MIGTTKPNVRIKGSGSHLRLRVERTADPLATVRECCRAGTAIDKALGEAIRDAVASGCSWAEVGRVLTGAPAGSPEEVLYRYTAARRSSWRRFWGLGGDSE
jgi:hypothetical protein